MKNGIPVLLLFDVILVIVHKKVGTRSKRNI